jgi:hypothetical protein
MVKDRIEGGEADPRSLTRGNFNPEHDFISILSWLHFDTVMASFLSVPQTGERA